MNDGDTLPLRLEAVSTPAAGVATRQRIELVLTVPREDFAAAVAARQAAARGRLPGSCE
jgi:hypothetical protein